ncbi:MAG: tripartite tricarboxylate transporter TctB family protein [Burkholderiaceae bacterium]
MRDRILGACALAFAVFMAWSARDYVAPIAYEPVARARCPCCWRRSSPWSGSGCSFAAADAAHDATTRADAHAGAGGTGPVPAPRALLGLAAILAYGWLFVGLGFPLATLLMTVAIARLFGGTWMQGLAAGVGLGLGLYLLFDRVLDVVLPAGPLASLFGGGG